ncbi:MAG: hypothetical protein ACXWUS_08135 [Burkholderiales bacterium]
MALPLLLAGPIVRRVEPTLASVWVALRDPATVTLKLWEGRVTAGSGNVLLTTEPPGTRTLRVGEKLHIALAVIKILPTSPRLLEPAKIYSYDLEIKTASETHTLKSLGLLTTGLVEGKRVEALGFEENFLPSFALPPAEITDLRVLFGSCRRPGNTHLDAMMWIDDLMLDNENYSYKDALKRPHQLFLGGDQIYADDVFRIHAYMLIELGKELIGTDQPFNGQALEHLPVDNIRDLLDPQPAVPFGFDHFGPSKKRGEAPAENFLLPADHQWFPAGRRFLETVVDAQMTTVDGKSHLFSLGEFAAMYLTVWSNACWPHDVAEPARLKLPSDAELLVPIWPERIPTYIDAPLDEPETRDVDKTGDSEETKKLKKRSPFRDKAYLDYDGPPAKNKDGNALSDEEKKEDFKKHLERLGKSLQGERDILTIFEGGLAKVRRALANIPTYMIFDDHDFTDDWNLNAMWYDRVYTTSLGVTSARNALASYALFQDWGNDPLKYEKQDDSKRMLAAIADLFPAGQKGPNPTAANDLDHLFGFGERGVVDPVNGSVSAVNPIIKWHFSVPGPRHLAVALDNRTRRTFLSRLGPPGYIEGSLDLDENTAQTEQIPKGPFTDGKEVLLVIAPLQVIGPPLLDELIAPAAFRAFDLIHYSKKFDPELKFGSRGMTGTNPDAIEAWAFDPVTLEALFRRLEPYRSVVLLSGDVHYSASTAMSYFTKGKPDPARFVQFTSSGFKNVMPAYITVIDRSIALAHRIVRAGIGAERLAWLKKPSNAIGLPEGATEKDIPRELRGRLKQEPVLLPTLGWPAGTTISEAEPPDWSWRIENIFDLRPDSARPRAIQPLAFTDANAVETSLTEPGGENALSGYQAAAARHQYAMETLKNSRQILFRSNFGAVRFERRNGVLHAIHEMYTAARRPEEAGTESLKPELFVLHEAALATPGAPRPEDGLQPLESEEPA